MKFRVHIERFEDSPEVSMTIDAESHEAAARLVLEEDFISLVGEIPKIREFDDFDDIIDVLHWERGAYRANMGDVVITVTPLPTVGTPATWSIGSDSYPYTISRVGPSGKVFWMRRDDYKRTDNNGMSERQEYEYLPDLGAPEEKVVKTTKGWTITSKGGSVMIGKRRAYQDPHR